MSVSVAMPETPIYLIDQLDEHLYIPDQVLMLSCVMSTLKHSLSNSSLKASLSCARRPPLHWFIYKFSADPA